MKIKAGYYIPQLPRKIAVTLIDGTTRIADITPSRYVTTDELRPLSAIEIGLWKPEHFEEWPPYIYRIYGFEKVD